MKRYALTALLALPLASLHAQATTSLLGGVSLSKVVEEDGNVSITTDNRTGFAAGLEFASRVSKGLFITPQFLYVQKGFSQADGGTSFNMKISYIEVPILLRADIGEGTARPFVFGGGYVAFKVGCSVGAETSEGSASATCVDAFDGEKLNSTDLGVSVGAGVNFQRFGLSARYELGFSNIPNDASAGTSVKNRSFLFLASVVVK